jgi:hypothetical protein
MTLVSCMLEKRSKKNKNRGEGYRLFFKKETRFKQSLNGPFLLLAKTGPGKRNDAEKAFEPKRSNRFPFFSCLFLLKNYYA